MIRYVERLNGKIIADYANLQPGLAEEAMDEDAPEFVAYRNPPVPVPATITRRQLILALATMALITGEEALAAARTGAVPAAVQAAFDNLSPSDKLAAEITWATMSIAERDHPLVALLAAANDMSSGDVDDFFRLAAGL